MSGMSQINPTVENMLDWTAKRQQTLAANIANMDTPGYRAQDVSFEQEMSSMQLASTDAGHISSPANSSNMHLYDVDADVNGNGNTVDLENQMSELTKNGMQYLTLVEFMNSDFKQLHEAISEGGKV